LAIVVLAIVALPAGALAYSLMAEKQYTATAKLLFRDPGFDQKLFGSQILAPSADPAREAATNLGLVSLDTVAQRTAGAIEGRRLTAAQIRDKVSIAAQGQSNVVAVSATDTSPDFAVQLANTLTSQYIAFRRDADRTKLREAVGLLRSQLKALTQRQRDGREGRSLRLQVEQLRVLAALQTGNAERVQPARTPRSPSSPKIARNVILALIIGVLLGVGLPLLLDRLDRRLRDRDEAESLLGRPVLGVVPESDALRADHGDALHLEGMEAEAFRTLRANLRYYDVDRDLRSLLITSAAPGDGKSTVARYLAATAAAAGVRAVLVEADLRRPTLRELYPLLPSEGLAEILTDQVPLTETIQQIPVSIAGAPTGRALDVIGAGMAPPNPTDLLESVSMRTILAELQVRYDFVVVDSSPVTIVPDSIPILNQVSGVLVVMRESKTTKVDARRLRDQLAHLGVAPLGLVMNGSEPVERGYDGYYSYAPSGSNGSASDNGSRLSRGVRRELRRAQSGHDEPAAS